MNLIDESGSRNTSTKKNSKKVLLGLGAGIIVLIFIIMGLLAYSMVSQSGKIGLSVDGKQYKPSNYLLVRNGIVYIGIEDLAKITNNGYSFKTGDTNIEDNNKCYIKNSYESTFFQVNSKEIYKILEDDYGNAEYYNLSNPIIKENDKMFIPIEDTKLAMNVSLSKNNNNYKLYSIGYLESYYSNSKQSKNFQIDSSIVWETTYSNKKLLKDGLVIVKDDAGQLGVAKVVVDEDSKKKTTKVSTSSVITPKYKDIKYVEQYNQFIVELENNTQGIIQLSNSNGEFVVKTVIKPQYKTIKPIYYNLYLVSQMTADVSDKKNQVEKFGIANDTEELVLPIEYDSIGIDVSEFKGNQLYNNYIFYDNLIPVEKDGLWGFINLKGNVVIKLEYSELGSKNVNSTNNILMIPELNAFIAKKSDGYVVITKSNRVLIDKVDKIYKESVNGSEQYSIYRDGEKYNLIDYLSTKR